MKKLPYIIISTAMSLDGYIDNTNAERLRISNEKDFDRVDLLRTACDAILIGANTIRKDNPRLLTKSSKQLIKVTLTSSGTLDPKSQFFTIGESEKIVYTVAKQKDKLTEKLSSVATVVNAGEEKIDLHSVLADLYDRGIKRLLVEGGTGVLTQFLQEGLVNELQIAIGGFFVGQKDAPRFVTNGKFLWDKDHRLHLDSVKKLDDIAVLIYKV